MYNLVTMVSRVISWKENEIVLIRYVFKQFFWSRFNVFKFLHDCSCTFLSRCRHIVVAVWAQNNLKPYDNLRMHLVAPNVLWRRQLLTWPNQYGFRREKIHFFYLVAEFLIYLRLHQVMISITFIQFSSSIYEIWKRVWLSEKCQTKI